MGLRGIFDDILSNYLTETQQGKFNKQHRIFNLINYKAKQAIEEVVSSNQLVVKGSSGAGQWTRYPWIAIYNTEITTTIQEGVYIVYLFSEDMSRLYLTLNQGCTNLKNKLGTKAAKEQMKTVRADIRSRLNQNLFEEDNDLEIGNIDYEVGSIFYKVYEAHQLPDEATLIKDLEAFIVLYGRYYKEIFCNETKEEEEGKRVTRDEVSVINQIVNYINAKGYIYAYEDICNFYLSLKTKPFVILAGTSGTGKSKLVKLFAEAVGATAATNQYHLISVKPDWNDSTELLGYKSISEDFVPGKLTLVIEEAFNNPQKPYFVCLDEMNLARVEYYLSEYLSIIESREFNDDEKNAIETGKIFPSNYLLQKDKKYDLSIPDNLYLIGTVNMDDTTFAFSRKVLDRANTIEFANANLENLNFIEEVAMPLIQSNKWFLSSYLTIKDALKVDEAFVKAMNQKVVQLNDILEQGNKCFGYRVRDEIIFYMLENHEKQLLDENVAFDFQIMQKILPTLTGSEAVLKSILIDLFNYCVPSDEMVDRVGYIERARGTLESALYPRSAKKILMMLRGYEDGFTSFWG